MPPEATVHESMTLPTCRTAGASPADGTYCIGTIPLMPSQSQHLRVRSRRALARLIQRIISEASNKHCAKTAVELYFLVSLVAWYGTR